jgi:hypothetical protein
VGNPIDRGTAQDELFWVTLFKHLQAAACFILITTLEALMAVRDYFNTLQASACFMKLEACLKATVITAHRVNSWAVFLLITNIDYFPIQPKLNKWI